MPDVGVPARLASCADWRRARRFAGGQVEAPAGQGHGAVLTETQAYTLFQHYCRYTFASQFKLYKLYTRAAAFTKQP